MTITVNGNDIDFTLEGEKTIGDVLEELRIWLSSTGMLVGDIEIDNQRIAPDEGDLFKKPIEEVEQLSIEALSIRESRIRQLEIAKDFFTLLVDSAKANDKGTLGDLETSYQDLKKSLPKILGEKPNSSIVSGLEKTLGQNQQKLISNAIAMLAILDHRLREASDPVDEAKIAIAALARLAENLDEVAVNLQIGRDKQAMDAIVELCEVLQKFIRCLTWGASAAGMETLVDDMNKMLSELEAALVVNDTVLIGDLLEYELKPQLMELPSRVKFDVTPTQ